MEVDVNDAVQPPTHETSAEPMEVEPPPPPSPVIPTLDIGTSHDTQTEKPRELISDTTFIRRDHPIPVIEWNPEEPQVLFTGGWNQSELFKIENSSPAPEPLETNCEDIILPTGSTGQFEVERFCWTAEGQAVVAVSEGHAPNSIHRPRTRLVRLSNWGADMQILGPISGIVFALQYQPVSQLLLCVCGLDDKSIIHVWRLKSPGPELIGRRRPVGPSEQPARVFDAAWISETQFIVCGDCELQVYETKDELQLISQSRPQNSPEGELSASSRIWSRLRYDATTNYAAVVDSNDGAMLTGAVYYPITDPSNTEQDQTRLWPHAPLPARRSLASPTEADEFTDFQWQPLPNKGLHNASTDDRLLGFSTAAGNVELYAVRPTPEADMATADASTTPFSIVALRTFSMGDMYTAAAFAFSPDGFLVAAAGFDSVFIWRTEDSAQRGPRAIWKWKHPHSETNGFVNGNSSESSLWKAPATEDEFEWPQSLQWDGDGRKLAFGVNDRVAIIRL